jgi:DNA polymerase-1
MAYGLDVETTKDFTLRSIQIYFPEVNTVGIYERRLDNPDIWNKHIFYLDGEELEQTVRTERTEWVKQALLKHEFITQNGLFDVWVILKDLGIVPKIVGDSHILASLIPSPLKIRKDLDSLMKRYVDKKYDKFKYGAWEHFNWHGEMTKEMLLYSARDAYACFAIEQALRKEKPQYVNPVYKLEVKLIQVLAKMKHNGLVAKKSEFDSHVVSQSREVERLIKDLLEQVDPKFNPNSTKQLQELLYGKLKLPVLETTAKGKPSCKESVLEKLLTVTDNAINQLEKTKENYGAIFELNSRKWLLETLISYKGHNTKLKGFKTALKDAKTEGDYYLFNPEFKSMSDRDTGRLYTNNPSVNSFNWAVRETIVPKEGVFFFSDIKQGELILLLTLASKPGNAESSLLRAYREGQDLFRLISNMLFPELANEDWKKARESAKTVVYAIIYGSEGGAVAKSLGITKAEGEQMVQDFLAHFQGIANIRAEVHKKAVETGLVKTALGRYRRLDKSFTEDVNSLKRQAFNFYVQSALADYVKRALVFLDRKLERVLPEGYGLVFTVFDSFLIQIPDDSYAPQVHKILSNALYVKVNNEYLQFETDAGVGENWLLAKENSK